MTTCPYCGFENIEGADSCEECEQSLSDMHLSVPATHVERSLLRDRVGVLNPKEPRVVPTDTTVGEVIRLMAEEGIGCVLIVEHQKLVGVFSERDALIKLNVDAAQLSDRPVAEFMTAEPETLQSSAKIAFACQRMSLGGYRHVPIVDDQNIPIGIISVRDIFRYLADKMTGAAV